MEKEDPTGTAESARAAAEDAVKHGDDIREEVRKITVDALSRQRLDYANIKSVVKAVLEGARDALGHGSGNMQGSVKEVVQGLDEALEKTAYASKLAIEETAGNVKEFTRGDLKRAMDDLTALEDIFFESLSEVAKSGKTAAAESMQELLNHLRNSGTAVGSRASEEVARLSEQFGKAGMENIDSLTDATRSFTRDLAGIASGFLAGLSDSLKEKDNESPPGKGD